MKKTITIIVLSLMGFVITADAQLQKGNLLVGGDIANFHLSLNKDGTFTMNIDPKLAYFIRDNVALGGYLNLGITTFKGGSATTNYGVGALGRLYVSKINEQNISLSKQSRFFVEANVGINGTSAGGSSTTGLGLGIGPGLAYFITPNIGLETLLKYNGIVGFGSRPTSSTLDLGIGFQIYLSGRRAKAIINNPKQ